TRITVGSVLIVTGVALFFSLFNREEAEFWLATLTILVGVAIGSSTPTVGVILLGAGLFMLLSDLTLINAPWLGYGLSILLVVTGFIAVLGASWKQPAPVAPRREPTAKRSIE
ncbi:hypothetical protein, partial [Pedobacter sp.]|uniref:hypothetical protein n=1 Tax=Pedobacter sp. TaxID=1411316 RepID=UPI003D7F8CBF